MANKILKEGTQLFSHPDDILLFMNRDICLVPEATTIIRNHMDTHNISECFAQRIDINTAGVLLHKDLADKKHYPGIDLFAFRKDSKVLPTLLDVDFELPYGYTLSICNICGEKLFNRIAFISHFFVPVDYTQNKKVTYKDILDEVPCFSN